MLLFIIFLLSLYSHTFPIRFHQGGCGINERYYNNSLSPTCDINCQKLTRICQLTTTRAVPGCYCQEGHARNLMQQCIPIKDCGKDCFPNEQPIPADGQSCESTCLGESKKIKWSICYSSTDRKCVCAPGYCRSSDASCLME